MNKLIPDIFENINMKEFYQEEVESTPSSKAMETIQELKKKFPEESHDELEAKMLEVFCIAEKSGFEIGLKYMCRLLMECLS